MGLFCVECGAENQPLIGTLCANCYGRKRRIASFPASVTVERCAHCGSRRTGAHWEDFSGDAEAALRDAIRHVLDVDPELSQPRIATEVRKEDPHNFHIAITVDGETQGVPLHAEGETRGFLKIGTCPRCSRIFGGYYESIVQVRSEGKLRGDQADRAGTIVSRILDRLQSEGNREAFLVKATEEKGGVDYYLGSTIAARAIVRQLVDELGARGGESPSLVGRKDGRDVYRVTFLARLPQYAAGSIVAIPAGLHRIQKIGPKVVMAVELETGRTVPLDRDTLSSATLLSPEEFRTAVSVSESDTEIQLLEPETMHTIELRKPPGFHRRGGDVRVVRWNGQWHLID